MAKKSKSTEIKFTKTEVESISAFRVGFDEVQTLLGRLEIFTVMLLFSGGFSKK